ncbi:MAG: S41 family peptidase [Pseudomonadota bacterium]
MRHLMLATSLFCIAAAPCAAGSPALNGVWQSDGYGFVLQVEHASARLFGIGGEYCVPETSEWAPLDDLLPGADFRISGDGQRVTMGFPLEPHRIGAIRLPALPAICGVDPSADPVSVFEATVGAFEANYPFFDLYDVDWPARVADARARLDPEMDERALFEHLTGLMRPIRDAHVALIAEIDGAWHSFSPNRAQVLQTLRSAALARGEDPKAAAAAFRQALWYDSIGQDILGGQGHMAGNGLIQYGMLTEGVGYLALARLGEFAPDGAGPWEDLAVTQSLMEEIFGFLAEREAEALILDLSLNAGGSDFIAREIARRFLHAPGLAYTKYAADARWPIETRVRIEPHPGARFAGRVFVLTSQATVSAAEVLTLALRTQPHVSHVGESTRGALSDAVSRRLPNGWQLHLSNEVYLDADGRHWEATGIPPEREIPVFLDADPVASHRRAIRHILREEGFAP